MSNKTWHDFAADILVEGDLPYKRYHMRFDVASFAALVDVDVEADPDGESDLQILRVQWRGQAYLILACDGEAAALTVSAGDAEAAGQRARWEPMSNHAFGAWFLDVHDAYRALPLGWSTVEER